MFDAVLNPIKQSLPNCLAPTGLAWTGLVCW